MNLEIAHYYNEYNQQYKSQSQLARVVTEHWFKDNMYCPFCSNDRLKEFDNNYPVADFHCIHCDEEFQLKSTKTKLGKTITDGEYNKMMDAINNNKAPNLLLLNYSPNIDYVLNLMIIPKEFILPSAIVKRNPLSENARRAGWTGCNIKVDLISDEGKILAVQDKSVISRIEVRKRVANISFLKNTNVDSRGWINDILLVLSQIKKDKFNLEDVYAHTDFLRTLHPNNNNIEAKIRQQLQVLRDNGMIEFLDRGVYRKI